MKFPRFEEHHIFITPSEGQTFAIYNVLTAMTFFGPSKSY